MIVADLLIALAIAIILTMIFMPQWRKYQPSGTLAGLAGFLWFFVLIFLASWLGGVWIPPVGPSIWGVYWFPFLMMGLLFALLLAAAAPPRRPRPKHITLENAREAPAMEETTFMVINLFYRVLLIALLVGILTRYASRSH